MGQYLENDGIMMDDRDYGGIILLGNNGNNNGK